MKTRFGLLFASLLLGAAAGAQDMHRVELIVFSHPVSLTDQVRHFEVTPQLGLEDAVDFRQNFCVSAATGLQRERAFRSTEEVAKCLNGYLRLNELSQPMVAERVRLEKSGKYRVLYHAAWQQPVDPPRQALPVRINNGQPLERATAEDAALNGTVRLSREQFLQLDLELLYSYPAPASFEGLAESEGLFLNVRRKLRPGDLNYIDHSALGILAQVTPIEIEEPLRGESGN